MRARLDPFFLSLLLYLQQNFDLFLCKVKKQLHNSQWPNFVICICICLLLNFMHLPFGLVNDFKWVVVFVPTSHICFDMWIILGFELNSKKVKITFLEETVVNKRAGKAVNKVGKNKKSQRICLLLSLLFMHS